MTRLEPVSRQPSMGESSTIRRRTAQAEPGALLEAAVHELEDLRLEVVGRSASALWNEYIDRYHYLGYRPLPGAQLRYFAYAGERVVGLLGFGAAAWKSGPRDEWIGWSREQRHRNLHGIVNNARFLIPPWIRVASLASKLLAMAARALPAHWVGRYGYRPVLLETFVESERFTGTCCRAANRTCVGQTQGRELEQLRCGACGALFVAHMPPAAGQETYDLSLEVNLAVAHYHLGLPFKRIESFQQLAGMPLPDATQWELVEQVADSTHPLYEYLERLGAQQPLVYQDDTGARIPSLIAESQADPPPERRGTGVRAEWH
jgi:hypothetical protein